MTCQSADEEVPLHYTGCLGRTIRNGCEVGVASAVERGSSGREVRSHGVMCGDGHRCFHGCPGDGSGAGLR